MFDFSLYLFLLNEEIEYLMLFLMLLKMERGMMTLLMLPKLVKDVPLFHLNLQEKIFLSYFFNPQKNRGLGIQNFLKSHSD